MKIKIKGNYIALCTKNYINKIGNLKYSIYILRHVFNGATYNNS